MQTDTLLRAEAKKTAPVEKGRWEFLDAVRGVAALMVVLQHGTEQWTRWFLQWSASYFSPGTAGVAAFFLVSGFIIPVSIERYGSLRRFWIGRFFRIGPMYYTSFFASIMLGAVFAHRGTEAIYHGHLLRFIFGNLIMMQQFVHAPFAIGVYWTLTYELIFYILCSLLFASGVLGRSALLAWTSILLFFAANLASALALHHTLAVGPFGLLVTAFYGTLLYRYFAGYANRRAILLLAPVLLILFLAVCWLHYVVYPVETGEGYTRSLFGTVFSWSVGYGVFALFFLLRNHRFPAPLLWLGRISYSLYLVHGLLILILPRALPVWYGLPLLLGVSLILSQLTYRWIERPAVKLQHRLFPHRPITQ